MHRISSFLLCILVHLNSHFWYVFVWIWVVFHHIVWYLQLLVWMCANVCVGVHSTEICLSRKVQDPHWTSFMDHFLSLFLFFEVGSLTEPEATLASQWISEICLSPHPSPQQCVYWIILVFFCFFVLVVLWQTFECLSLLSSYTLLFRGRISQWIWSSLIWLHSQQAPRFCLSPPSPEMGLQMGPILFCFVFLRQSLTV